MDANAVQPRVDFAKLEARGFYVAPNPDQLAVQQRLRGDFGLDTSAERIANLADAEDTAVYLGVVGTREELALVDRQMSIQAKLVPIDTQLTEKHANTYGGVVIDHKNGGEVTLLSTDGTSGVALAQSLLPEGTKFRVRKVDFSLARMFTMHELVDETIAKHGFVVGGTRIVQSNMSPSRGVVEVFVEPSDEAKLPEIEADLAAWFPTMPVVTKLRHVEVAETVSRNSPPPPYYAGYFATWGLAPGRCTPAFVGVDSLGRGGFFTAGHCTAIGTQWAINGYWAGTTESRTFSNNANSDSEFVLANNGTAAVYVNGVPKHYRDVKDYWANGAPEGSVIHISSAWANEDFDDNHALLSDGITQASGIVDFDVDWLVVGDTGVWTLHHGQNVHACADHGMSGSPVYTVGPDHKGGISDGGYATATGILSAVGGGNCTSESLLYYSRISNAMSSAASSIITV